MIEAAATKQGKFIEAHDCVKRFVNDWGDLPVADRAAVCDPSQPIGSEADGGCLWRAGVA